MKYSNHLLLSRSAHISLDANAVSLPSNIVNTTSSLPEPTVFAVGSLPVATKLDSNDSVVAVLGYSSYRNTSTNLFNSLQVFSTSAVQVLLTYRLSLLLQANILNEITVIDRKGEDYRFNVRYSLLSVAYNTRYVVETILPSSRTNSLMLMSKYYQNFFPSANWLEREAWDMFGIFFIGNTELSRILNDYGFEGHPLRKDFPLPGYYDTMYAETEERITSQVTELELDFRQFNITIA